MSLRTLAFFLLAGYGAWCIAHALTRRCGLWRNRYVAASVLSLCGATLSTALLYLYTLLFKP